MLWILTGILDTMFLQDAMTPVRDTAANLNVASETPRVICWYQGSANQHIGSVINSLTCDTIPTVSSPFIFILPIILWVLSAMNHSVPSILVTVAYRVPILTIRMPCDSLIWSSFHVMWESKPINMTTPMVSNKCMKIRRALTRHCGICVS